MLFEFIGIALAAGVAYLSVFAINRLVGYRLPRWFMPVAAGCAMIAATISLEYSWYDRISKGLPAGVEVIGEAQEASFMRPWTYVKPMTTRFSVVDTNNMVSHSTDGIWLVNTLHFARWTKGQPVSAVIDCNAGNMAPIRNINAFLERGKLEEVSWLELGMEDPLIAAVCS